MNFNELYENLKVLDETRAPKEFKNDAGQLHSKDDRPSYMSSNRQHIMWHKNGKLHREKGPAETWGTVTKYTIRFWKDGEIHRSDGPAEIRNTTIFTPNLTWYKNGVIHRSDGPAAITFVNGQYDLDWYTNGTKLDRFNLPKDVQKLADGYTQADAKKEYDKFINQAESYMEKSIEFVNEIDNPTSEE